MSKILVLDAGHGLKTAGKRTMDGKYGVVNEWTINDKVLRLVQSNLGSYDVTIYRTDDPTGASDISLDERVRRCNSYNPHLFVSIHHNAGGGTGTEVYWHTKGTAEDKKVASILAPKLASKCGMRNRGVKQKVLGVLNCKSTAILVEGGFMDTKSDYEYICSEGGQRAYAEAVTEAIVEYLGLKKVSNNNSTSNTSTSFKVGDKVKVKASATHYATGQAIASFVKGSEYEVTKVKGNKLLLSDITSWVWDYDVDKVNSSSNIRTPFKVEIICNELNIRQKADFNSKVVGTVKRGDVFTILEEENGLGKLKSGAGYISMGSPYVRKL